MVAAHGVHDDAEVRARLLHGLHSCPHRLLVLRVWSVVWKHPIRLQEPAACTLHAITVTVTRLAWSDHDCPELCLRRLGSSQVLAGYLSVRLLRF